jgi:hypothetical protein
LYWKRKRAAFLTDVEVGHDVFRYPVREIFTPFGAAHQTVLREPQSLAAIF